MEEYDVKVKDQLEDFWLVKLIKLSQILNNFKVDKFIAGSKFSSIQNFYEQSKPYPHKCELCSPDGLPMKSFVIILHTLLYQVRGHLDIP